MKSKVILIRHSERIDEINLDEWFQLAHKEIESTHRNIDDLLNDPILTQNGKHIANTASMVIESLMNGHMNSNYRVLNSFLGDECKAVEGM